MVPKLIRILPILGLASLLLFISCAQDVPDIDRTQPRAVKKSIFRTYNEDGSRRTWYFMQTVTDVPFGTAATFTGEQNEVEKIFWEIQEQNLYAYRAYEYVTGSEQGQQRQGTGGYRGAAVAAFRIESHFDIQRSYNAATGEQTNVIVENTSDRPWHKRAYMRVDFSKNLVTDFRFVASNVQQQPIGYYIPETETNNKDRAKISDNNIDIVHKVYITPEVDPEYMYYYGISFPVCWLWTNITDDCLGQTIKIRSSFIPTDPKNTYKGATYSQQQMDKFGYFRTIRYDYNREYGLTEKGQKLYANRWNIWKDHTCVKPASGNTPPSYASCETRKIAIHVNDQFPEELKIAGARVVAQWNGIFREMVKRLTQKDQGDVFIFCQNNPVKEGDDSICGETGYNPQIGDLRATFLYWVNEPLRAGPLGYGPSSIDPQTGEIFGATAYIYGAELDAYVTKATDIVRLINGDLKHDDIANATHVETYIANIQKLRQQNRHFWHGHHTKRLKRHLRLEKKRELFKKRLKRGIGKRDWVSANLKAMQNAPGLEDVIKGEFFKAFGLHLLSPNGDVNDAIRKHYGLHRIASRNLYMFNRKRRIRLSKHSIMMADFIDETILARALRLKKEFAQNGKVDYTKVRLRLREEVFRSVALHEIGHTLGLRHNFAASADALNYFDEYWKLRAKTIPSGATSPVPVYRYTQANINLLDNAIREGMREYQYSSIMDYGASFSSDLNGLGKYDRAAIMYGYAGLVETFKPGTTVLNPTTAANKFYPGEWHYTQLPTIVSGSDKPYSQQILSISNTSRQLSFESEVKAKNLVEIPYRFCTDEYHGSSADCYAFDVGADYYERVQYLSTSYWNYYIFDAFKRGRLLFGLDVGSYIGLIYDRYYMPIADQYKHFLNDWWFVGLGFDCGGEDWYVDPKCGENGIVAAVAALNFFARIIQTPDIGCYRRATNNAQAHFTHASSTACQNGVRDGYEHFNVPLGIGRGMYSRFNYTKYGFEFAWKPTSVGAWWDKYMAVMALGDPYTSFYGIDTSADFNSYMINFNTMFGRYVNNLVGGFILGRNEQYAPVIQNGKVVYRDPIRLLGNNDLFNAAPTYSGTPLNPNESYSAQYSAGLLATVYFSFDLNDQYFNESMKISVKGRRDAPEVPDDVKQDPSRYIELTDPGSHRVYYAVKVNNMEGSFVDEPAFFSVGYEHLKRLKEQYFNADGKTLKSGVQRWEVEAEFHFINVILGWLHEGEINVNGAW